jgi:hypothetical protein
VGCEIGEGIAGEAFEGGDHVVGAAGGICGVGVGFVFVFTAPEAAGDADEELGGFEEDHEEDEAEPEGGLRDAEGFEQLGIIQEQAHEEEEDGELEDSGAEALDDVVAAEVADFVGEDGEEFRFRVFVDEGIEEGDAFVAAEASEEGVGFGGAAAAIDDEDIAEGELASAGEAEEGRRRAG